MTTSRTPFVPFRAPQRPSLRPLPQAGGLRVTLATGLALLTCLSPAAAQDRSPRGATRGQVVWLPPETAPPVRGPLERLNGRHVAWEFDDGEDASLGLGETVPQRTLVSIIERRLDSAGGRDQSISVETLGPALLIRGGLGTSPEALAAATKTAEDTIAEYQALADGVRFRTRVRLLKGNGQGALTAENGEAVIDTTRVLGTGQRGAFGATRRRSVVADFDVEVASAISVADPSVLFIETGETVHLWASTTLTERGERRLYVQGLLDVAVEGEARRFDPDLYELGVVEQPTVLATQVLFAGIITPEQPLVVTLDGLSYTAPQRRLEITAEALNVAPGGGGRAGAGPPESTRVVDLARGMWRANLSVPHAMDDTELAVAIQVARMPASGAQLVALMFGREAAQRPDLGSTLLMLPLAGAQNHGQIQDLFESIDPVGPAATLEVAAKQGGFRATVPAGRGSLLRVARTQETVYIVDYDPQIANEATLADPRAQLFLTGEVLECVVDASPAGPRLQGVLRAKAVESVAVREVDPRDVGRIQHPVVRSEVHPVSIGKNAAKDAVGWVVKLK